MTEKIRSPNQTAPVKMSDKEYTKLVLEKLDENHIWLNKMTYFIHPSDEEKIKLANMILDKLTCKSTQIPSKGITSDDNCMRELAELTPILYLRVNWS